VRPTPRPRIAAERSAHCNSGTHARDSGTTCPRPHTAAESSAREAANRDSWSTPPAHGEAVRGDAMQGCSHSEGLRPCSSMLQHVACCSMLCCVATQTQGRFQSGAHLIGHIPATAA
jgi:hypothetical protein